MEFRHLRYFVAAAEELNISRAAARLHVSQPPLSRQIRDLEQEIGTPLFERGHKGLKLTSAGAYFLPEAKNLLWQAQRAATLAKAAGTGQAGKISIAFVSPLGGLFLPRIIRSFRQKLPLVDLDLHEMVPRQQLEALLDHQIDLAFVAQAEVESPFDGSAAFRASVPRRHRTVTSPLASARLPPESRERCIETALPSGAP
jgi:DNA-binding transcriptional LysR family regulator